MSEIVKTQEVTLFRDEQKTGTQKVYIDPKDVTEPWIIISHCGEELSMSLTNWNKLKELVASAQSELQTVAP